MKKLARVISVVFHPAVLILLLPFLIVYNQTESSLYALKWQIFSSLFVFLAGFMVFVGEAMGIFSDADVTKRKERGKFYAIIMAIIILFILVVILLKGVISVPVIIASGVLFGVLLFAMLNYLFKISIHSGTACAFVIVVGILYGINVFFAILWILPFMIWARLITKNHTLAEAIFGALLGGLVTIVTYFIGKILL